MADDMPLSVACDLADSFVTKQVRPFERIAEVLRLARDAERRALEADKRKGEAEAAVIRAQDRLAEVQTRETAAFNEFKAANDTERKRLGDLLVRHNNEVSERLAELESIRSKAIREHETYLESLRKEREVVEEETSQAIAKARSGLANAQKAYEAFMKKVGMA